MLLGAGGGGAVLELLILYRSERLLFDGGREGDLNGASVVPDPPSLANCLSGLFPPDVSYLLQFPWPNTSVLTEGMLGCGVLRSVRFAGKGGGSVTSPLLETACVCGPSKLAGVVCIRARMGF